MRFTSAVTASLLLFTPVAYADSFQAQINALNAQIAQQQQQAAAAHDQVNTIGGQVALLNAQIASVEAQLALTRTKQAQTAANIEKANLRWLQEKRKDLVNWSVHEADARVVMLPHESLAIVSEGYLGQNFSKKPDQNTVKQLCNELGSLYITTLQSFYGQLEPGSDVSITIPVWNTAIGWLRLEIIDPVTDMGYTLRSFAHCDSRNLIYRRPNQIVGRQLLLLRKP